MAKVEVVSSEKLKNKTAINSKDLNNNNVANNNQDNTNQSNAGKIISFIVLFIGILIFFYNIAGIVTSDEANMSGCYAINDTFERNVSLCFNGSTVTYSYHGSTVTLNVEKINNSVYIKNEYDDYMFNCDISTNNSNKMKCKSYNQALGSGDFYFEKK